MAWDHAHAKSAENWLSVSAFSVEDSRFIGAAFAVMLSYLESCKPHNEPIPKEPGIESLLVEVEEPVA